MTFLVSGIKSRVLKWVSIRFMLGVGGAGIGSGGGGGGAWGVF